MIGVLNIIEEGKLGGPQVRMVAVSRALRSTVATTLVLPGDNSAEFQRLCKKNNVPFQVFGLSRITREFRAAVRYIGMSLIEIFRLVHFFRSRTEEIIHVSGGSWQFKGVLAGRLAGKKVLWHLNDTSMPGAIRTVFKLLSPLADGYIFASERSRAYYGSLVDATKPQFLVPAPVDTSEFNPLREFPGFQANGDRWPGKVVVGVVGNINRVKGLETFIRMASEVNGTLGDIQFVVVGPVFANQRHYYDSLQSLASSLGVHNIEFVGGCQDVRPLLKRFDVYVCSSNAESSPIAVWEAMAMGLPVVSTDVGDVPLYVKNHENGFVVPVRDPESMADRVCLLAKDESLRDLLGRSARTTVVENLDIDACAGKHYEAYCQILNVS